MTVCIAAIGGGIGLKSHRQSPQKQAKVWRSFNFPNFSLPGSKGGRPCVLWRDEALK